MRVRYPYLAVGLGPSNLSLAALASSHRDLDIHFVEKKERFDWYEGILSSSSTMQSSFIRDLVSLVEPTNKYSFISYLHEQKRLHHFLAAGFNEVPRFEFNDYYKWAAEKLDNVHFGQCVNEVHYDPAGYFNVHTSDNVYQADNLILGAGNTPYFPNHSLLLAENDVFHGTSYSKKDESMFRGKRVVVVGGGQTGAEVFLDLFNKSKNSPSELTWVSRRASFNPMEESPFLTEIFTPGFSEFYFNLDNESKKVLLQQSRLASDGVSKSTLSNIYQTLYKSKYFAKNALKPKLMVSSEVTALQRQSQGYSVTIANQMNRQDINVDADIVIYCTGFEFMVPVSLYPISDLLTVGEGGYETNADFSVKLKRDIPNKIYVQNGSTLSWGVADRNLVLGAWRSAKIINSMMGSEFYDLSMEDPFINWSGE